MKALVLKAQGVLCLEERPMPPRPRPDWVLVRVKHSGICGSDLHRAFGGGAYHYPLVMGHEFSGVVEESFAGSSRRVGDPVAVYPLIPCRRCEACELGAYARCKSYDYLGSRSDGGFAEYVWAPEENCIAVPEGVELVHAALAEPAAVSLHGVRRLGIHGGETAVVFGGGPIGILTAQWLRFRGCLRVIVVELEARKLELAREMGFEALDPAAGDPVEAIRGMTRGSGADLAVEACGLPVTYRQAIQAACPSGQVLLLGNIRGELVLSEGDVSGILRRELSIRGTWNSGIVPRGMDDWSVALAAMRRSLAVAPLISHTPALEDGPEIFRRLEAGGEPFRKVVFAL